MNQAQTAIAGLSALPAAVAAPEPPNLKTCDRQALALAKFLRRNESIVKSRPALLNGTRLDIFRLKRAKRALEDPAYETARKKFPALPELTTDEDRDNLLRSLARNRLALPVNKLETPDALARGLHPESGIPCVQLLPPGAQPPQAPDGKHADDYYIWRYKPQPFYTYFYVPGIILGIFTLVLFPMWPVQLRVAAWYVIMSLFVFLAVVMALGVLRLVVFGLTVVVLPRAIWLVPNLFAEVGIIDSFLPLWAWQGERTLPQKPKRKKRHYDRTKVGGTQAPDLAQLKAQLAEAQAKIQQIRDGGSAAASAPNASPQPPNQPQQLQIARGPDGQLVPVPWLMQCKTRVLERVNEEKARGKYTDQQLMTMSQAFFLEEYSSLVQREKPVLDQIRAQLAAQRPSLLP